MSLQTALPLLGHGPSKLGEFLRGALPKIATDRGAVARTAAVTPTRPDCDLLDWVTCDCRALLPIDATMCHRCLNGGSRFGRK